MMSFFFRIVCLILYFFLQHFEALSCVSGNGIGRAAPGKSIHTHARALSILREEGEGCRTRTFHFVLISFFYFPPFFFIIRQALLKRKKNKISRRARRPAASARCTECSSCNSDTPPRYPISHPPPSPRLAPRSPRRKGGRGGGEQQHAESKGG